jgi:hypothetical protein
MTSAQDGVGVYQLGRARVRMKTETHALAPRTWITRHHGFLEADATSNLIGSGRKNLCPSVNLVSGKYLKAWNLRCARIEMPDPVQIDAQVVPCLDCPEGLALQFIRRHPVARLLCLNYRSLRVAHLHLSLADTRALPFGVAFILRRRIIGHSDKPFPFATERRDTLGEARCCESRTEPPIGLKELHLSGVCSPRPSWFSSVLHLREMRTGTTSASAPAKIPGRRTRRCEPPFPAGCGRQTSALSGGSSTGELPDSANLDGKGLQNGDLYACLFRLDVVC